MALVNNSVCITISVTVSNHKRRIQKRLENSSVRNDLLTFEKRVEMDILRFLKSFIEFILFDLRFFFIVEIPYEYFLKYFISIP